MATEINDNDVLFSRIHNRKGATFVDLNPRPSTTHYGEFLLDETAIIIGSLHNLLRCPIGDRGRIHEPQYGTMLYSLLQEPMGPITASKIRAACIQAIERWEPRAEILADQTAVIPDRSMPGYLVQVGLRLKVTKKSVRFDVGLPVSGV